MTAPDVMNPSRPKPVYSLDNFWDTTVMRVPQFDLRAQTEKLGPELLEALRQVLYSGAYVQGAPIEELQRGMAAFFSVPHAVACSSGTDALLVSLMALDVGPGDEVITTPFSFFATLGVVLRLGAKPVLVDIEDSTFNMDPQLIEAAITPKTKAIIPVHLYGQCADMSGILALSKKHSIPVIEDCAQSLGASYPLEKGGVGKAGAMGELGCISFYPSKNLGALGDAGMVLSTDDALGKKVAMLRNHGQSERYIHPLVGGNFRMDGFQAAVLNVKLKYLEGWIARRQQIATRYSESLTQLGLPAKGVVAPARVYQGKTGDSMDHVFHQYVIRAQDRNSLKATLETKGVGCGIYYPVPFHHQPCWTSRYGTSWSFPRTEKAAAECLALPIFPEMSDEQVDIVVSSIAEHYGIRS
jgi:dTDP-4-amino-4,6-dideoxygalactose transaminase